MYSMNFSLLGLEILCFQIIHVHYEIHCIIVVILTVLPEPKTIAHGSLSSKRVEDGTPAR